MIHPFSSGQSYRVFLNDKIILISEIINIPLDARHYSHIKDPGPEELKKTIISFMEDPGCLWLFISVKAKVEETFNELRSMFFKITAGGGILNNDQGDILFIFRRNCWDLPKGKVEDGETIEEGAIREVIEETGLKPVTMNSLFDVTYHIYKSMKGKLILKETYWFEMSYNGSLEPVVETEEDITEARWFAPAEIDIPLSNTFPLIKELIEKFTGLKTPQKH
jgi:8-oxo-dGTP pyrophosphatase MutT (NUDIX family)